MAVGRQMHNQEVATLIGNSSDSDQQIFIRPKVLHHLFKYRQLRSWSKEAGGQLFGSVTDSQISVSHATGPYPRDQRGRHYYRSDEKAAQQAISQCRQKGLLYIGEWHSHAEDAPSPSGADKDAMQRLLKASLLNLDLAVLLIVGRRTESLTGLALLTYKINKSWRWSLKRLST